MLASRGALLRLAALLGVHEEEQGASELLVVALRFGNLKDGALMRAKNHLNQKERRCTTSTIIREEVERLQARLNGRDAGQLLDEIEAEGFEPLGWNLEVAFSTSSVIFFRCLNISCSYTD